MVKTLNTDIHLLTEPFLRKDPSRHKPRVTEFQYWKINRTVLLINPLLYFSNTLSASEETNKLETHRFRISFVILFPNCLADRTFIELFVQCFRDSPEDKSLGKTTASEMESDSAKRATFPVLNFPKWA